MLNNKEGSNATHGFDESLATAVEQGWAGLDSIHMAWGGERVQDLLNWEDKKPTGSRAPTVGSGVIQIRKVLSAHNKFSF